MMKLPSLPPGIGGTHAIALVASGSLMAATAGFRAVYGEFSFASIAISGVIFLWDAGTTGLVHWIGFKIAASQAVEDRYEAEAHSIETVRRQAADLERTQESVSKELAEAQTTRARRIEFDFDVPDMKAWASTVITTAYVRAVNVKRGRRFSRA